MKKKVSIVMACYNMAKFLPSAITSILNQTFHDFELIIINDGSIDDTEKVIKKFLNDKRIKYIYQDNQGQPKAKNLGIKESSGDLIAFLDADDRWAPEKLEIQLPCFNKSSAIGVVYTNLALVDENDRVLFIPQEELPSGKISEKLFIDNFIRGMTCIAKRECFEDFGSFDENIPMGIDWDLWLRFSTKYEFYYLNEVTYYYRSWPGQMSHNFKKRYECAIRIMKKFLENYPDLLSRRIVNEAWAHTYTNRGLIFAQKGNDRRSALKDIFRALRHKPCYMLAWKGLAKLIFNLIPDSVTRSGLSMFIMKMIFALKLQRPQMTKGG